MALLVVIGMTPASAASDPQAALSSVASAEAAYEAGKTALRGDDTAQALAHFKRALKLADGDERTTWQMLLAVAVTYQKMDRPAFAIEYYTRFLKRSDDYRDALTGKWSNRRANAAEDIEALETKTKATHGFVTVVSEPSGAAVLLDGAQAGADGDAITTFGGYVKAGSYQVTLRLEGHREVTRTITVREGKLVALKERLESLTSVVAMPPPHSQGLPSAGEEPALSAAVTLEQPSKLGPWIVIGTGGAMAVTGAVLGAMAASSRSEWTAFAEGYEPSGQSELIAQQSARYAELESETKGLELGMVISAAAALAAIGGGILWWLLDTPAEPAIESALPTLHFAPTPQGAYGAARWSF